MSFSDFPPGTIGNTLAVGSMKNSITVGPFVFALAASNAGLISSGFVTQMPFASLLSASFTKSGEYFGQHLSGF